MRPAYSVILFTTATGAAYGLLAVLLPVYQVPYQYSDSEGQVLQLHADLGYFVDMVVALPESQAANGWAIFMGKDSEAACGVKDAWYHWGALMLATGIRAVSGLPAAPVTLVIVNALLNILLIVSAGALAERVTRTGAFASAAIGALAITCVHLLRLPQVFEMLALWLPYDIFHHARVPLALIFPYKFEGVLMLTSYKTPDPLPPFTKRRPLALFTADSALAPMPAASSTE